jgi:hypothetical protein
VKTIGPNLWQFLGWSVQGDFGPYTTWTTDQGKVVVIQKAPPKTPASVLQQLARSRFSLSHRGWRLLTPAQRAAWTLAAHRARLSVSGYNLWMSCNLLADWSYARTVFHQAGIDPTSVF